MAVQRGRPGLILKGTSGDILSCSDPSSGHWSSVLLPLDIFQVLSGSVSISHENYSWGTHFLTIYLSAFSFCSPGLSILRSAALTPNLTPR